MSDRLAHCAAQLFTALQPVLGTPYSKMTRKGDTEQEVPERFTAANTKRSSPAPLPPP